MRELSRRNRRDFLRQLSGGFGAVALHALMQDEARAAQSNLVEVSVDPINPFLPRIPHFAPKAKSVIFMHMVGGPSQMDSFDYKPLLQKLDGKPVPQSFREAAAKTRLRNIFTDCRDLMGSPFKISQHGESGMWISELFLPNFNKNTESTLRP